MMDRCRSDVEMDGGTVPLLDHAQRNQLPACMAQRYLAQPFLLDGKKCDARMFALIVGSQVPPLFYMGGGTIWIPMFVFDVGGDE